MKVLEETITRLFSNKAVRHTFFCMTVLLLFIIGMATNSKSFDRVAPKGITTYLFLLACVYTGRWLFKRLQTTEKKGMSLWILTMGCILILVIVCTVGIKLIFNPYGFNFPDFLLISLIPVLIFLFIGITITIFYETFLRQINDARISEEQKQSELSLLQSQLSPHFLFNTLNNMYSLSITQQQRLPNLLLKLSDLLRYSIYNTKKSFVLLRDEVNYIRNYMEFENLRVGDRLILTSKIDDFEDDTIQIAPMLLIVFIENAFKHSKNIIDKKVEIDISMNVRDSQIYFCVKNSFAVPIDETTIVDESSGLGLNNAIKRLNLLYPDKYIFCHGPKDGYYQVTLQLKTR